MRIQETVLGKQRELTDEEIRKRSPLLAAWLDDDDCVQITIRRSGGAFVPETYRKLDGYLANALKVLGPAIASAEALVAAGMLDGQEPGPLDEPVQSQQDQSLPIPRMHEKLTHIDEGTSRIGTLSVTYAAIISQLGEPNIEDDPCKVDASWGVKHEDGRKLFVWNYKNGKAYLGPEGRDVEDITSWSLGGDLSLAKEIFGAAVVS